MRKLALLFVLALAATSAAASPITYLDADRELRFGFHSITGNSDAQYFFPPDPHAPWLIAETGDWGGTASQQSVIALDSIVATGAASQSGVHCGEACAETRFASSGISAEFVVAENTPFTFTGLGNFVTLQKRVNGFTSLIVGTVGEEFSIAGTLLVGEVYTLHASSMASNAENPSAQFSFAFTVGDVPEPSTALLLALGLAAFARRGVHSPRHISLHPSPLSSSPSSHSSPPV